MERTRHVYISGVYQLVNTVNDKCYIGSAFDLHKRKKEHFRALRGGYHYNSYLQRAYNKYGESVFSFHVICRCSVEEVLKKEQFYIDKIQPEYNLAKSAASPMRGRKHTEQTKQKMANTWRKFLGTKEGEKWRALHTGDSSFAKTEHSRAKMREKAKAYYASEKGKQAVKDRRERMNAMRDKLNASLKTTTARCNMSKAAMIGWEKRRNRVA